MSRSLDLHPRTIRRIGRAAKLGEAHPVSPGVLVELATLARERAATMETGVDNGPRLSRTFETIAVELDEAARLWTSTRRPRRVGQ